jgi:hypothetical protein
MLVELRIGGGDKGAATLVPPSVHPSGEQITWDIDHDPAAISGEELKQQATDRQDSAAGARRALSVAGKS